MEDGNELRLNIKHAVWMQMALRVAEVVKVLKGSVASTDCDSVSAHLSSLLIMSCGNLK